MPKSIVRKTPSSIKEKYHQKVLSSNAIYINWIRMLDIQPLFARIVWLDLSIFDLSQLGLGLLYYLLPIDLKPFTIDFDFELPSIDETLQGIWMKFKPVNWEQKYDWLADFEKYIIKNFKKEYREDLIEYMNLKAIYGKTQYARSYYDPFIPREMMRSTMIRLRLMRTPDTSWLSTMQTIQEVLEITGITDDHVFNRVMMHYSAQSEAFVLGMAVLGKSKLCKMDGDFAVIPFMDSQKNMYDLKFRTLDHIQLGFILGVTPIGYGLLLPKESIYRLPEGKKNPPIIDVLIEKMRRLTNRLSLTTWAYCYDEKTEVLTEDGFKKFYELTYDDKIATLNPKTGEMEYYYPVAIHKFKYQGKMIHIKGKSIDLLVTPEHQLYCGVRRKFHQKRNWHFCFIKAIDLYNSYKCGKFRFKRGFKWNGEDIDYFILPEYEKRWSVHGAKRVFKQEAKTIPLDSWLRFFGWYISEGDTEERGCTRIYNTYDDYLAEINNTIQNIGFTPNLSYMENAGVNRNIPEGVMKIYSVQLANYLKQFGKAKEKFVPKWIKQLPSSKLKILLEPLTKGDGYKTNKNWKYYTSSKRLADDLQEIALKAGFGATITEVFWKQKHWFMVSISRKRIDTMLCKKPELVNYNGYVYDVTVPKHHIILVRRNGKVCWSSNSNYNRPREMGNYHESERTNQYDLLQAQRRQIEQWVYYSIPPEESNAVKIRQYQNAVLQAISWKAKRHKWGFKSWEYMTEEQFKEWWINHWETQGLKRETLNNLYGGMSKWLERLREEKVNLGSRIQRIRKRLAMSV